MTRLRLRKPTPAMAVAIAALFVAFGSTAVAAFGPFKGDKIIKKNSLSGNRLKSHTISGKQINLGKLGPVPSARNSLALGSQPPGSFARSSQIFTSPGFVSVPATGNPIPIYRSGPFTITYTCTNNGGGSFTGKLDMTSTEANSVLESDVVPTAGTVDNIATQGPSTTPSTEDDERVSAEAPSGAHLWIDFQFGILAPFATCWYSYQGVK